MNNSPDYLSVVPRLVSFLRFPRVIERLRGIFSREMNWWSKKEVPRAVKRGKVSMFPLEFDHSVLDSLPVPLTADVERITNVITAIVVRRVVPYFKRKRGTDPILASRVEQALAVQRLEDLENRVRAVCLVTRTDQGWSMFLHERVFDYLAFVIPSHSQSTFTDCPADARKMMAFAEFMIRHEIQHILYPDSAENEVIASDAAFAMDQRANDPTFYRALRGALADEMNGLKSESFRNLLDYAEQGQPLEPIISKMLNDHSAVLVDLPEDLIQKVFPSFDASIKSKVLGVCFQRSRDTTHSLLKRTYYLQKFLRLFELVLDGDRKESEAVFEDFKQKWGLLYLIQELGLTEASLENRTNAEIMDLVKRSLKEFSEETKGLFCSIPTGPLPPQVVITREAPTKSLKDRVEEARNDPSFPLQVLELIEENKSNALGHSGSKYSELIETLLAVPWGKNREITVSPQAFEEGLHNTHYGLAKPKETIIDFFSGLIWRYQHPGQESVSGPHKTGSAFLFVGPPGVGKTSLAISIATNLGIPYHKLSLGGMRDEADLRGHGFTYEGSKPGAIVQGLIKMGYMNGMFIMDEADKVDKFAVATLLEILDPEQNHLFHDKYTQTTVDIDLSNCHFILTANTLETVPAPVLNRCEVVFLDRYSVDEKIAIAKSHLINRVRDRYQLSSDVISFDPEQESDLLRFLVRSYTHEAGVRELERIIRTLFIRILRKEILSGKAQSVIIDRQKIIEHIELPRGPRMINEEDRVGEIMALGINVELGIGSIIPVQATPISSINDKSSGGTILSVIHATGNIERVMDESRKVATTAILHCSDQLGISVDHVPTPIHLHFMGGSTPKDGPSAGGAIALALASVLSGKKIRRDVAVTGEIDTQGRITLVGGLDVKLETSYDAGCRTVIIPKQNLYGDGGVERLSDALKGELQVRTYEEWRENKCPFDYSGKLIEIVAVDHIVQAADIAFINEDELSKIEMALVPHARSVASALASARVSREPAACLLYVKSLQELESEGLDGVFWEANHCVLVLGEGAKEAILERFPVLEEQKRWKEYDPLSRDVAGIVEEMADSLPAAAADFIAPSLVAPYYFLQSEREKLDKLRSKSGFEGLKLFANNFTTQGVKVKGCKATVNRLMFHLSHLDTAQLRECSFLEVLDGVYVLNMAFIPEKYRLDLTRAERILTNALKNWLTIVEG